MVITSYLQLIDRSRLPDDIRSDIDDMGHAVDDLLEMVGALLDVSKMEEGRMSLNVQSVNLNELAGQVLRKARRLKGQRGLTLSSGTGPVEATCDPDLILRVMWNLVGNALKCTSDRQGEIDLSLEQHGGGVRVTVSDNGYGVPPEYHERIFEKFGQVETRKQGRKYSTGLGLTFCKMAVEAHGGRIGLESELDHGSVFWFELPK